MRLSKKKSKSPIPMLDEYEGPLYRRSHPYRAFLLMTAPFLALVGLVLVPFVGWVLLLVLLPIEFGRIGGRRLSRPDAVWVAVPTAAAVATYEIALMLSVLISIPGGNVQIDALGLVVILSVYGANMFFFSVGALSTAFDPEEPVESEAAPAASP